NKIPFSLKDKRVSNKIDVNVTAGPRDEEQKNAINDLYNEMVNGFGYCSLSAPPAAGKIDYSFNIRYSIKK
ncbi:MAG: hypothetical protein ACRCX2_22055, partial [Paraclostridium sp.]